MPELEEWCNVGEEQFLPCLHKLSLVDCPKLKELPSDFPSAPPPPPPPGSAVLGGCSLLIWTGPAGSPVRGPTGRSGPVFKSLSIL
ncbi:hypothetical protein KSP40_PGU020448 [Platanthera guangdongensis]|uniref:Uncharacterized protein n=1 Tax=Platanthera guangdongensis TaxID=2320717 RepID=A0ABR2M7K5_9ASPA